MKENSMLWFNQNRLWIRSASAAVLLSTILLSLLTMVVPKIISAWYLAATSRHPTLAEIAVELAIEQTRRDELSSLLDSLALHKQQQRSYEAILTAIKDQCDRRQVSLIGYDRIQQSQRQYYQTTSYRLLVEGRFRTMALLLADLEALSRGLTIQSIVLEQKSPGSGLIRGVLMISAGLP